MKFAWIKNGLKMKIGKGKAKHTIKIPLAEILILGFGLVEGIMMGGFTGGLIGLAIGGVALLTCMLGIIPFVGQFLYHTIMMYVFSIAHVQLTNTYLIGFILSIIMSFLFLKSVLEAFTKKLKTSR